MRRSAVIGGVVGPVAFVAAWAILGARASGYSPVDDPISRLAAVGAPTRWAMTAGMLALAGGLACFARGLADEGHRPAARAAVLTAVAALGIAATPLDGPLGGAPHAAAAGVAYASLVAVPVLVGLRREPTGADPVALAAAGIAALALVASMVLEAPTGTLQRAGLTVAHAWIVGHALRENGGSPPAR